VILPLVVLWGEHLYEPEVVPDFPQSPPHLHHPTDKNKNKKKG